MSIPQQTAGELQTSVASLGPEITVDIYTVLEVILRIVCLVQFLDILIIPRCFGEAWLVGSASVLARCHQFAVFLEGCQGVV